MQNHLHATARGVDHGHVIDISRRLEPFAIDLEVVERRGEVEWDLFSSSESKQEMLRNLRSAVKRSTGRDCVRAN